MIGLVKPKDEKVLTFLHSFRQTAPEIINGTIYVISDNGKKLITRYKAIETMKNAIS